MTNSDQQIVTLYEEAGISVNEIALAMGLEEGAVRLCLGANSAKYRASVAPAKGGGTKRVVLFEDNDMVEAAKTIRQVMEYAEDDSTRLRAARAIIQEAMGRNDAKLLKSVKINVNVINEQMKRAREAKELARTIDIVSSTS